MTSAYFANPLVFLIDTVFALYILAVFLRFLLHWSNADFYNPISQFLVRLTHPPLRWLRRFVPPIGRIDSASLVLLLALQMISDFSILLLKGLSVGFGALLLLSFSQLLELLFNIFIFAIFARAILSWLNPGTLNAVDSVLYYLTEPVLGVCRRIVPDLGGVDLSPLVALIVLQVAKMIFLPPLQQLARLLS